MIETEIPARREDVRRILAAVRPGASRAGRATLTVLVGLPASGKSWVADELRARTGAVVLESDALRRLLFPRPTHAAVESQRLFAAIHDVIDQRLARGVPVVLDATNLIEAERAPLYEIAARHRATLILVHVTASDTLIRRRLARREADGEGYSDADTLVYERMRSRTDKIQRPHHVVDTSQALEQALTAIAKEMITT